MHPEFIYPPVSLPILVAIPLISDAINVNVIFYSVSVSYGILSFKIIA